MAVVLKAQQRLRAESDCQATAKASEHVRVKKLSWLKKIMILI